MERGFDEKDVMLSIIDDDVLVLADCSSCDSSSDRVRYLAC